VPPIDQYPQRNLVRNALKDGLKFEQTLGANPFKFGFVGGTDTHNGNAGTDPLGGGAGDALSVNAATTDVVNDSVAGSSGSNDTVRLMLAGAGTYTMTAGVETAVVFNSTSGVNVTGNASANTIVGNAGNNTLLGGAGNDTITSNGGTDSIDGGADTDTLVLAGSVTDYVITRPTITNTVFSKLGSTITVTGVELVQFDTGLPVAITELTEQIGSPGNDTLNGSEVNDTLDGAIGTDTVSGFEGDDTIWGGTGADSLIGGTGTDILDGGDGSDAYRWTFGDGDDFISQNDTISTDIDVLQLAGVTADQVSFSRGGFTYNDLVVTVQQGDGDEAVFESITVVDFFTNDAVSIGTIDQVVAQGSATTFTQAAIRTAILAGSGNGTDVFVGFETNDSLPGTANNDWILAGAGNDTIGASEGNDSAFGGLGNDSLSGGEGDDLLVGGAGADTIAGGAGDDRVSGGAGSDLYVFGVGGGHDVISEPTFALTDDELQSGIGPVYVVTDGDTPLGGETDTLQFQAGIAEADVRATRSGNDLVLLVGAEDSVTVTNYFGNGVATIERVQFSSGVIWTATQIKAKVLVPTGGDDEITGYLSGEKLNGLGGNDTIDGREGADTITGGAGDDVLTGGRGNDRFVLDTNDGSVDTITDFASGADTIALSKSVFTAFSGLSNGTRIGLGDNLAYDADTGELSYDADGAGGSAGVVIAIIGSSTHPGALGSDFVILA
jgi:Ca2+-binding RTX toxin-like protein